MTRKEREAKAEVIVRLRSQLEWPWDKIAAYVGYHRKSCQRIFREACKRSDGSYVLEEERKRYFKLFDEAHELIDELLSSAFLVRGDPRVAILKQKIDLLRLHATVLGLGRQPADRARQARSPMSAAIEIRDRQFRAQMKQIDIHFNEIFGRPA